MMRTALLMMLIAGLSGACASLAEDVNEKPSIRLTCHSFELRKGARGLFHGYSWQVLLGWKLESTAPWNIAWCDESKARVTVQDAAGNKAGASDVSWSFTEDWKTNREGSLRMYAHRWAPAMGARWIEMKGEVPMAVSCQDVSTEPVTVELVKGFSVPVVLKGAGLAGEDGKPVDVQATLKVKGYEDHQDDEEKGGKLLYLELSANQPLGFREFELQTVKDLPVIAESWNGGSYRGLNSYRWNKTLKMDMAPVGEVKVMVRYAQDPRLVKAVVDSRAALSGLGGGEGEAGKDRVLPGENRKAGPGGEGARPAVPAAQPGLGGAPAVKAELAGFEIKSKTMWMNNVRQESPLNLFFRVKLETKGTAGFGGRSNLGEQSLEVTDSTGRVLAPAVFDLGWVSSETNNGVSAVVIDGNGSELASPGAEWVRVKGMLRVPMAGEKESPVYELPLVKGAEQHIPVPGMEETGENVGDVATAGDAPTCKLWLEEVTRKENGDVQVEVSLLVEGVPFYFDAFELIDDKGKSLDAYFSGGSSSRSDSRCEWSRRFTVRKAAEMKKLRVKLKYKTGAEMAPVPVDMTVGLGGPVPQKAAGGGKAGKR